MRPWFVYILLCDQKTFYVGITEDIRKRLREHQRGYSRYTKKFSNVQFLYEERCKDFKEAEYRERQLKGWSVAKKKALIAGDKSLLIRLSKGSRLGDGL